MWLGMARSKDFGACGVRTRAAPGRPGCSVGESAARAAPSTPQLTARCDNKPGRRTGVANLAYPRLPCLVAGADEGGFESRAGACRMGARREHPATRRNAKPDHVGGLPTGASQRRRAVRAIIHDFRRERCHGHCCMGQPSGTFPREDTGMIAPGHRRGPGMAVDPLPSARLPRAADWGGLMAQGAAGIC